MKTILKYTVFLFISITLITENWLFAQPNWTTTSLNTFPSASQQNRLGTSSSAPFLKQDINIYTSSVHRMKINQTLSTTINGTTNVDVTGYVGIGRNSYFATNSPWSLLHLEGDNNTVSSGAGWRTWMRTGVFMKENSDAMYVGLQQQHGQNRSDAVINWSDDPTNSLGIDKLRIAFTGVADGLGNNNYNPLNGSSYYGYEFMRFTFDQNLNNSAGFHIGNIGIGPAFDNTNVPCSRLHINAEDRLETWLQISNQTGTGQTAFDGLRIGITNNNTNDVNIRQQENGNIVIYTDYGANNGSERMRITQIGTPWVPHPGGLPTNTTRVSISEDGDMPVDEPRSLLHLGRNVGINAMTPNATDGWREWMDIGMFVSNGSDNAYFGLKNNSATDRFDAVINWGDNQGLAPQQNLGPDNLLFIFTATTTGTSTPPANQFNGVEGMRMTPTNDLVNTGIGGNPGTNPYYLGGINPTLTLEVNSPATTIGPTNTGLRFTDLNSTSGITNNPGNGVLSVDETGRVIYVPGGSGGFQFGDLCSSGPSFSNDLTGDWHVGLNDFNLYFANGNTPTSSAVNNVGIGYNCVPLNAKLDVLQISTTGGSRGINVLNTDNGSGTNLEAIGIRAKTSGVRTVAGWFEARSSVTGQMYNAIFVPKTGGSTRLGFNFPHAFIYPLEVEGAALITGGVITPSDYKLKKDFYVFSNGLNVIRNINTFSYKYNGLAGYDSIETHIGIIAEDLALIAPYAIDTFFSKLNESDTVPTELLGVKSEALIYTAINAIKELDSIATGLSTKIDSTYITAGNGVSITNTNNIQLGGTLNQVTNINLNNKKLIFSDPANAEINTNNITIGSDIGFSSKFGVNNITDKAAGVFFTSFPGYSSGNWGIIAAATGTWGNIGGQFAAENGSSVNYGIFSSGRGGQSNAAGYFDGDLVYTGELYKASDLILKENIVPISNALNTISQLQPKTFNFKTTEYPDMNLPTGSKFGLIAQEVETIVPGLVKNVVHPATYDSAMNIVNDAFNYKSVDYEGFIPILIQAVKELGQQNSQKDSLLQGMNDRLTQLETMFTQCCNSNNKTLVNPNGNDITVSEVELENRLAVVLDQNVPNPFAENTVINYFIPDEIKFAQIIFSDNYGKIIKTVDINNSGYGMLKVYAANLSSGIYTYSIIIDGKVVDTKKMVCAK